jgi:hypothetical protein
MLIVKMFPPLVKIFFLVENVVRGIIVRAVIVKKMFVLVSLKMKTVWIIQIATMGYIAECNRTGHILQPVLQ